MDFPDRPMRRPPVVLPVATRLESQGAAPLDSARYNKLGKANLHLAQAFRQTLPNQPRPINPIYLHKVTDQAQEQLWVDVVAEFKSRYIGPEGNLKQSARRILKIGSRIGRIVTGRVLARDLPRLEHMTRRLEVSRGMRATELFNGAQALGALQSDAAALRAVLDRARGDSLLPPGTLQQLTGADVIIGIIDFGCNFRHPALRTPSGNTRLAYLWDQTSSTLPPDAGRLPTEISAPYGVEYNRSELDQDLDGEISLPYPPPNQYEHGTTVACIAAGSPGDYLSMAPKAELIFVHLGLADNSGNQWSNLGGSTRLLDAISYIIKKAEKIAERRHKTIPLVINLSMDTLGGPHDGSTLVEKAMDELLAQPNRAIVLAAGNDAQNQQHTNGQVPAATAAAAAAATAGTVMLGWKDITASSQVERWYELEIWYEGRERLGLALNFQPDGAALNPADWLAIPDLSEIQQFEQDEVEIYVRHQPTADAGQQHINLLLKTPINPQWPTDAGGATNTGTLWVRLNNSQALDVRYHCWIDNDANAHSWLDNSQAGYTISGIAGAARAIVVGGYTLTAPAFPAYANSSRGPSRNPNKTAVPDLSAPGENVPVPPFNLTGMAAAAQPLLPFAGTSAAAPIVSGAIALLYQAAQSAVRPMDLNAERLADILRASACPTAAPGVHDPQSGYGRLDVAEALRQLFTLP